MRIYRVKSIQVGCNPILRGILNLIKSTKNPNNMAKFEFITETNSITNTVRYYTEKDGAYVDDSISADKDRAYERFIKAASGVSLKPNKEVTDVIYSITE
jgi:hypothetical protein